MGESMDMGYAFGPIMTCNFKILRWAHEGGLHFLASMHREKPKRGYIEHLLSGRPSNIYANLGTSNVKNFSKTFFRIMKSLILIIKWKS